MLFDVMLNTFHEIFLKQGRTRLAKDVVDQFIAALEIEVPSEKSDKVKVLCDFLQRVVREFKVDVRKMYETYWVVNVYKYREALKSLGVESKNSDDIKALEQHGYLPTIVISSDTNDEKSTRSTVSYSVS